MAKLKIIKEKFIKIFRALHQCVNILVNFLLLSFVYIVGIMLVFVIQKLLRKKFFDFYPNSKSDSYWQEIDMKNNNFYRQF